MNLLSEKHRVLLILGSFDGPAREDWIARRAYMQEGDAFETLRELKFLGLAVDDKLGYWSVLKAGYEALVKTLQDHERLAHSLRSHIS